MVRTDYQVPRRANPTLMKTRTFMSRRQPVTSLKPASRRLSEPRVAWSSTRSWPPSRPLSGGGCLAQVKILPFHIVRWLNNEHDDKPCCPTGRRLHLPAMAPTSTGLNLWNLLCKNIGKDLSKISMPVTLNEPLSALQVSKPPNQCPTNSKVLHAIKSLQ